MTELEKRAARMKWDPPRPGTEERKEMPASAFLMPGPKKYPYKVKIDGQWVVSIPALRSAISVANSQGDTRISSRASAILEKMQKDDEIKHHGILGMRWGIRRQRGPDGRVIPGTIARESGERRAARGAAAKGVKRMSNAEIRAYVERMNLEKQFAQVNKKEISAGRKFVNKQLEWAASKAVQTVATNLLIRPLGELTK